MDTALLSLLISLTQPPPPLYIVPTPVVVHEIKLPDPPVPAFTAPRVANTYAWGNCTWYVANKVSIPNSWGHARTWYARAEAQGYITGDVPKPGAIAWFPAKRGFGHVAYVEEVYADGSYLISEMNVKGLGKKSSRVISGRQLYFIYGKI